MKRYFFIVQFIPKEANCAMLAGRCISIMHGFVCKNSIEGLGVSFPSWSVDSIGNTVAFVHTDKKVLSRLLKQKYFQEMIECGFFNSSSIEQVPIDSNEVRYIRNQSISKAFSGAHRRRLLRLKKRALVRGEVFNPSKCVNEREFEHFHKVPISSHSNKHDFMLFVQKDVVNGEISQEFGSYGLATNQRFQGCVPDLSQCIPIF